MAKLSRVLAICTTAAAVAVLPVAGAQVASASPAKASAVLTMAAKTAPRVSPQDIGRYAGCTFRVNAPQGTNFNTGITNYILQHNWYVYTGANQDVNQNLWYMFSYSFGISGWVDWHDLTLAFCNPQ
jgi:hypothetical protein